jgi:hypothetical protein
LPDRESMSLPKPVKKRPPTGPVDRLFAFVLRSRILIVGRDVLARSKSKLHFVLIAHDLSENSRSEILSEFIHYPVVQRYTGKELENFFGIKGAKVIGFKKSGLAQSLYAEWKEYRINSPVTGAQKR